MPSPVVSPTTRVNPLLLYSDESKRPNLFGHGVSRVEDGSDTVYCRTQRGSWKTPRFLGYLRQRDSTHPRSVLQPRRKGGNLTDGKDRSQDPSISGGVPSYRESDPGTFLKRQSGPVPGPLPENSSSSESKE